jgi:NitT/TauT family transport system substrate-binding protein
MTRVWGKFAAASTFLFAILLCSHRAGAETIKIGLLPVTGGAPVFIAKEKGYFAAEGLEAEIVLFDAGQPVAVATVSGDIDFGNAGVTSALYTLAGQGALRIIAGFSQDRLGFHADGMLASNAAY